MKSALIVSLSLITNSLCWGSEATSSGSNKFIALYRGIHFFENLFSPEERGQAVERCFSGKDAGQPLFSSAAGTLVGARYLTVNPAQERDLLQNGKLLHDVLLEFKNNHQEEYNIFHQTYTNNHYKFHTLLGDPSYINERGASSDPTPQELKAFEIFKKIFSQKIESPATKIGSINLEGIWRNCFLSFSQAPRHALKYAVGQKYMVGKFLRPEYDSEGRPKNEFLGKIYVALIRQEDFKDENPTSVLDLYAQGKITVQTLIKDISAEAEVSFLGYLPGKYIAYSQAIKVPSFNTPYVEAYKTDYGLDRETFRTFKRNKRNLNTEEIFDKGLLEKYLIPHYSKKLESIALRKIQELNGELTFVGLGQQLGGVLPSEVSVILHSLYCKKKAVIKPGRASGLGNKDTMTDAELLGRIKLVAENVPVAQATLFMLKDYPLAGRAGPIFKTLLLTNTFLKELCLENLSLTPQAVKQIAEGLQVNISLTKLSLQYNPLEITGCTALASALECNKFLEKLDIRETGIGEKELLEFCALLVMTNKRQKNQKLTELLFTTADIPSKLVEKIDNGLRRNILNGDSQSLMSSSPETLYKVGCKLLKLNLSARTIEDAVKNLITSAEQGYARAQYKMAEIYLRGQYDLDRDFEEGMNYLISAASLGHPEASVQLACYLLDNYMNSKPTRQAKEWILRHFKQFEPDVRLDDLITYCLIHSAANPPHHPLFSDGVELFYAKDTMDIEDAEALYSNIHYSWNVDEMPVDNSKADLLRVIVNTLADSATIELLVDRYQLNKEHPFSFYQNQKNLWGRYLTTKEIIDEKAAQGNEEALEKKFNNLKYGLDNNYESDREAAHTLLIRNGSVKIIKSALAPYLEDYENGYSGNDTEIHALNECLADKGDTEAIARKIEGLARGFYGYEESPEEAVAFNERLIQQGDAEAIERKLVGLINGRYGYQGNRQAAIAFNEELIKNGNIKALKRKIKGLESGLFCYRQDHQAAHTFIEDLIRNSQFSEIAVKWKMRGLTQGRYGYKIDLQAAIALNEALAKQGHKEAIKRKIEEFQRGKYFYVLEGDTKHIWAFNEGLIEHGDVKAIKRKIRGLITGYYGYMRNPAAAVTFNEELVKQGNEPAIKRKIKGLANGYYGYRRNPVAAVRYNEELIEQGNELAKLRRLEGLLEGKYGYKAQPTAAVVYNDRLVEQGNESAIQRKIEGLTRGIYGYKRSLEQVIAFKNSLMKSANPSSLRRKVKAKRKTRFNGVPNTASAYIDILVRQGDKEAIRQKIEGLTWGLDGYKEDPKASKAFNEYLIDQGDSEAIIRKIEGLVEGLYGYDKDPQTAKAFNESLVMKGDKDALKRKTKGLAEGRYGYKKDIHALRELNEQLIERGDQKAILRKAISLLGSKWSYKAGKPSYPYGYETNLDQFLRWIEEEENKGSRWAYYIKAQGLKYGIFGFSQNREAAIEYIQKHRIPY